MTEPRITIIPRAGGMLTQICAIWRPNSGHPYRCMLDITREVATWNEARQIWVPQVRLCHLHAIEYVTGKPVLDPTYDDLQRAMLELSA